MISCLTVTQESRMDSLTWAVHDFARQTLNDKELVIVHDGSSQFHDNLQVYCGGYPDETISIYKVSGQLSLGALRNFSVECAQGDIVCQWDDDDRYHSQRLEVQYQKLQQEGADFCFLTDQLHYFTQSRELFWDDWNLETYPMNLIQGTLMGVRDKLPRYPDIAKGEDTPVIIELVEQGHKVSQLVEAGYLYWYQFTGENTWDFYHHGSISALKRYRRDRLQPVINTIMLAIQDYGIESLGLAGQPILMPTDDGVIELFNPDGAE